MATTFQNIIDELNYLGHDNWGELEAIKPKAIELLKRTFPNDYEDDVKTIRGLTDPGIKFSIVGTTHRPIWAWAETTNTLRSILLARKETYEHFNSLKENQKVKTSDSTEMKNLQTKIDELEITNAKLKSRSALKSVFFNLTFLGIVIALIFGFYTIGYNIGNARFDSEKNKMSKTIDSLQQVIKSCNTKQQAERRGN